MGATGARLLFWGDIQGKRKHFRPLYVWLCNNVVFSLDRRRLDDLPPRSRRALLSCCAAFMAYYYSDQVLLSFSKLTSTKRPSGLKS